MSSTAYAVLFEITPRMLKNIDAAMKELGFAPGDYQGYFERLWLEGLDNE